MSWVFGTANSLIVRAEIERDKNDRFRYPLQHIYSERLSKLTKSVTDTSNESRKTLKRTAIILFPIAIFVFIFASWNNSRPDGFLSSLDAQFPVGEDTQVIVQELENLGFDYTLYEYSHDRFRVTAGTPSVSPFLYFPNAPTSFLESCGEADCSIIRSSKLEYVYVFGFFRFHHTYRYLIIFHDGKLVNTLQDHGYWSWLL